MLDQNEQKEALHIARITLQTYLDTRKKPLVKTESPILKQRRGCFITLRTKKDHRLRGCIGQFEPNKPLYQIIQDTAISAATKDPRFPPLTVNSLPDIAIEISVMTPKKKVSNWQEIKLGKHGVVIKKGSRGGTFLPQVATETNWSLDEFLGKLCLQKAGLPSDCYKDPTVEIYTFEVQIVKEE